MVGEDTADGAPAAARRTASPRRRRAAKAVALIVVVVLAAGGLVTAADLRDHATLTVLHSAVKNATDTGEVEALKAAATGRLVRAGDLAAAIAFVDGENDGSDFRLVTLLRLRLGYAERLDAEAIAALDRLLGGVRYWMDEPGANAMVYWTENHQVLFAADELLAGQLLPDATFRDGRTGAEHAASARTRLLFWLGQRWQFGFSEWNSHYAAEDVAALANLVDFAADPAIRHDAEAILDLLLLDVASHVTHGEFIAASSRLYGANRMVGDAAMRRIAAHAFTGEDATASADDVDVNFLVSGYATPPVLAAIAADTSGAVVERSEGRDPADAAADGALATEDQRIMAFWGMEAITNPETVATSFDYIRTHGLLVNPLLAPFRQLDYRVLRWTGALPLVSRGLDLPSNGIALGRGDIYGYRTPAFSMTTAQAYRPGGFGNQEAVFSLTLDTGVTLFHNHPAVALGDAPPNGNSPDYWTGDGYLPISCQHLGVNASVYDLPDHPGFGRSSVLAFTHLHVPFASFDQSLIEGSRLFLRRGAALIGVTSGSALRRGDADELIADGRQTFWIVEASTTAAETFDAFAARVRGATVAFDGRTLSYQAGGPALTASMDAGCAVDGVRISLPYPRLPARYATTEAGAVHIAFGGQQLDLTFDPGVPTP